MKLSQFLRLALVLAVAMFTQAHRSANATPLGGHLRFIPITGDADSDISTSKTYTAKVDFGTAGAAPAINGVTFQQITSGGAFTGGSTTIPTGHPGNGGANASGSIGALLTDMVYNTNAGTVTLTGLTVGRNYDLRLYNRDFSSPGTFNRTQSFAYNTNGVAGAEDFYIVNPDNSSENPPSFPTVNRANAMSYIFTARSTTATISINNLGSGTYHMYGLSNELSDRTPIPSLYSTGLAADGSRLADGANNPHYFMTANANGGPQQAIAILNHPGWLANDAGSGWIGPQNPGNSTSAAGGYTYRSTFDLTGFDPSTAEITASVFIDDNLTDILLNGASLALTASGFTRGAGETFSITSGFDDGVNTLEFVTTNGASGPTGFRVILSGSAVAIPEPSAFALAVFGLLTLGPTRRRRRR